MKKFLFLILCLSLFRFDISNAQANCSIINSDEAYRDCCIDSLNKDGRLRSCDQYLKANPATEAKYSSLEPDNVTYVDVCPGIQTDSLLNILLWIKCILRDGLVPIIFGVAFLYVMISIARLVMDKDSKKQEEHKKTVLWAMVGLFVMVSVWGIVRIVSDTLGLNSGPIPLLQTKPYEDK